MKLFTNIQGGATSRGRAVSAPSVPSWPGSAAGAGAAAVRRPCQRIRLNDTKGWLRTARRRGTNNAATTGTTQQVSAGSTLGRRPNPALQRIAARWRILLKPKGNGWAARAEGGR
jgi:hypothetical protein